MDHIKTVERTAAKTKIGRLLQNPVRYLYAVLFKEYIYPYRKKEILLQAPLFFGGSMKIALPAATDIYITGGKSHFSEIKLAKFLIANLQANDTFVDIGAHYGYFSLLAAHLVGQDGKVYAFEPSPISFQLLKENAKDNKTIQAFNQAMSDEDSYMTFHQFPNLYSEYNAFDIAQYEAAPWFEKNKPTAVKVLTSTIDACFPTLSIAAHIIKMDVEGAENKVIKGGLGYLLSHHPIIIMEYVSPDRHNTQHQLAAAALAKIGYQAHIINQDGSLSEIQDIDQYLIQHQYESDNIVFKKK